MREESFGFAEVSMNFLKAPNDQCLLSLDRVRMVKIMAHQ